MDNEELAELPFHARLLFIYMWMLADREGRLEDRPKRIGAQAFPYDREVNPDETLTLLQRGGFIDRYMVDGVACIQINGFTKHQTPHHKETASELPPPEGRPAITRHAYNVPEDQRSRIFSRDGMACLKCGAKDSLTIDHVVPLSKGGDNQDGNLQSLCHRCNSAKGDAVKCYIRGQSVDEEGRSNYRAESTLNQRRADVGASCPTDSGFLIPDSLIADRAAPPAPMPTRKTQSARSKTQMPEDFGLSERVVRWAQEGGYARLPEHLEAFKRKAKAKGYTYVDWDSALMEAIREDWAKLRGMKPVPAGERATSTSSEAERTQEYLKAHDLTPEERAKAEEARKRVMSAVKVINREAA